MKYSFHKFCQEPRHVLMKHYATFYRQRTKSETAIYSIQFRKKVIISLEIDGATNSPINLQFRNIKPKRYYFTLIVKILLSKYVGVISLNPYVFASYRFYDTVILTVTQVSSCTYVFQLMCFLQTLL